MLLKKGTDRNWESTDFPGIERSLSLFRTNDTGGQSSVVRLAKGSVSRDINILEQRKYWFFQENCIS